MYDWTGIVHYVGWMPQYHGLKHVGLPKRGKSFSSNVCNFMDILEPPIHTVISSFSNHLRQCFSKIRVYQRVLLLFTINICVILIVTGLPNLNVLFFFHSRLPDIFHKYLVFVLELLIHVVLFISDSSFRRIYILSECLIDLWILYPSF